MQSRYTSLFVLFLVFLPLACSEKIEPGTTAKPPKVVMDVRVATARITDEPLIYEAVGTVKAGISSKLASKLLGTVEAVRVREGDLVKKGDTLILIDERQVEAETKERSDTIARELIADSVQRLGSEQVAEVAVSTVPLPNDDMKGRIIGRGGRNIRAFEQASGVDVVVDDTPEAVIISSFDPIRRETARVAMSKLILDGRIHPARIEKVVADSKKEVEAVTREAPPRIAVGPTDGPA